MQKLSPHPDPLPKGEGNQRDKLLIIDGNAIIHRAYHAYPAFMDDNGNFTNAIYGFYAMLLKMLEEVKPDYLVICFDRGAPTFRMNMYAGYHANRPKMSDDLSPQIPKLQESLERIGIPLYGIEGYEADDLIGTLSVLAKREDLETVIVTGDRDLLQLVNGQVKVLMPITGITKTVLMDSAAVKEKYGIMPSQIIDYKALVGDASDNYPGVAGIGPKTAAELLQKYETFENLYAHITELPPKIALKLAQDAEQAALCKKLATIEIGAPVHFDKKASLMKSFTIEKFVKEFEAFGFDSLKKRMLGESSNEPKTPKVAKETKKEKEKDPSEQLGLL